MMRIYPSISISCKQDLKIIGREIDNTVFSINKGLSSLLEAAFYLCENEYSFYRIGTSISNKVASWVISTLKLFVSQETDAVTS